MPSSASNPLKRPAQSQSHAKTKGKGKGKKAKGKGTGGSVSVPDGAVTKIGDKPLCFAFSCGSCKFKVSKKGAEDSICAGGRGAGVTIRVTSALAPRRRSDLSQGRRRTLWFLSRRSDEPMP